MSTHYISNPHTGFQAEVTAEQKAILDTLVSPTTRVVNDTISHDYAVSQSILGAGVHSAKLAHTLFTLMTPAHFEDKCQRLIFKELQQFWGKYGGIADYQTAQTLIKDRFTDHDHLYQYLGEVDAIYHSNVADAHTTDYLNDKIITFSREQEMKVAVSKTIDLIDGGHSEQVWELWRMAEDRIQRMGNGQRTIPTVGQYIDRGKDDYAWIIPNKLRAGVLAIMGGDAKVGKTTAVYNAFCDMIVKGEAWGEICKPVPVIHLDFETDATFIRKSMFDVRDYSQDDMNEINKWFHATDYTAEKPEECLPQYLTIQYLDEITKGYDKPGVIVPDTLRAAFAGAGSDLTGKDANWDYSGATVRKILTPYLRWCKKTGWTILFLAHNNKAGSLYGSVDFRGVADQILTLTRDKDKEGNDTRFSTLGIIGRMPATSPIRFEFVSGVNQFVGGAIDKDAAELAEFLMLVGDDPFTEVQAVERTGWTRYKVTRVIEKGLQRMVYPKLGRGNRVFTGGAKPAQTYTVLADC